MERDGLIRRVPDPSDGRLVRIHLTAKAKRLKSQLAAAGNAVNEAAPKVSAQFSEMLVRGNQTAVHQLDVGAESAFNAAP